MSVPEQFDSLLESLIRHKGSDLYVTHGAPPAIRMGDGILPQGETPLTDDDLERYTAQALTPSQRDEFDSILELNSAILWKDTARFRINFSRQRGHICIVARRIQTEIPSLEALGLPALYGELVMKKRGLILVAGPTGSGKTTSLAAMIGHRNRNGTGHIVTIEDPIEFVHRHEHCIISQRDVGLDTYSYAVALKNALRQRPDLVVIGEVRDRDVMEQAIYFAETGHLCIATIHANNASQAIERVLNFFPEERHPQILLNLALNLRGVLSQRLVAGADRQRVLAMEIMLNNGLIRQLIEEGKIRQLRDMIERGGSDGMQSFDQHLFALYNAGAITEETAIHEADNPANLRMMLTNKKGTDRMVANDLLLNRQPRGTGGGSSGGGSASTGF